jgi:carbon-monoxide dehydrogenase large subunit
VATLLPDGTVRVDAASSPSGQGHETTLATVAAEVLAVPRDRVDVHFADGRGAGQPVGIGTFASRAVSHTGNAVHRAALALRDAVLARAAGTHAAPDGWHLAYGQVRDEMGRTVVTLANLAGKAGPLRARGAYDADEHTYPYGAVTCAVAVDPELFTVRVERLAISCDAGRVIDESVVRGQLVGGLVQGVGAALWEELPFAADGRPVARNLDGYLLPTAADVPDVAVTLLPPAPPTERSPANPLGVRGIGEAGTAAGAAAVAAAVAAALPGLTQHLTELPMTPSRLLAAAGR